MPQFLYMIFLLLCIFINGLIGVVFKLFSKYEVDVLPAIIINYLSCVVCGLIFINDPSFILNLFEQKWIWVAMGLGFLFIVIFNAYAKAIHQSGVGLATIFQKMSLIAPVLVALLFYNESFTLFKGLGLGLSIFALFLLSFSKSNQSTNLKSGLGMLLLVFFGSCVIDTTFYLAEAEQIAPGADVGFVSSLFFFAMVFGLVYMFLIKRSKIKRFNKKSFIAGLALGVPNFFSIYLLLKVIAMGWEGSVVFPANNVGVLSLAALFGVFMFNEEVTFRKIIGFLSAVASIILLSFNS